jgi:hypothetical protein
MSQVQQEHLPLATKEQEHFSEKIIYDKNQQIGKYVSHVDL